MRVLAFFLNDCEYGRILRGAERRFFEVATRLRNWGVEIFALEYESLHSEKWGQLGYFPIKIKRRFSDHAMLSALRAILRGLVTCLKHSCDIVYVTSIVSGVGGSWVGLIAPYIVSCLCRKPLVIIFHHIQPHDFRERNPIRLRAYRKATCMAVSKATATDVEKRFGVRNVTVVGNGVNLELFKAVNHHQEEYDAVFLGRVAEEKGIFDLFAAWKDVVGEMPSAQLLLIGGVERDIGEKLYKRIKALRLEQNVTVYGFASDTKAVQLLKSSKIFVLPSHMEGFGLVVAEAMAASLPCILSDLPALREFYSSAAIFVQPKNVERLTEAILFLLSNPEKRRELQKKGQKLVSSLSWEEVASKEFNVLKSLLSKRKN